MTAEKIIPFAIERFERVLISYAKEITGDIESARGSKKKAAISNAFAVSGIPFLVVLNDKGLRVAGDPRNDVAALVPEVALEKWKQNIVEPSNINPPNACHVPNSSRPVYEGEQVSPPKDLTIDPDKSIFGCPYGSTEKK